MKSCLKCATDAASSPASHDLSRTPPDSPSSQGSACERPKSVSFCEVSEEDVFYVDDWDRSPAAVTERLTYRDVYELKELRIALPRIHLTKRNT